MIKNNLRIFICFTLLIISVYQPLANTKNQNRTDKLIKKIEQYCLNLKTKINQGIFKYEKRALWGLTTEGGDGHYYFNNNKPIHIHTILCGETFQVEQKFYYKNGDLIFIDEKFIKYNRPIYWDEQDAKEFDDNEFFNPDQSTITNNKYYLNNDKLIEWQENDIKKDTKHFKKKEKELFKLNKKIIENLKNEQ